MSRKTRKNSSRKSASGSIPVTKNPPHKPGLAGFVLGSITLSGTLFAAQPADTPPAPAPSDPSDLQEVVVTGIRASLQKSWDIKRESVGVVDAISAEDIGKFPDSNMATAMARIPGVTVSRALQ